MVETNGSAAFADLTDVPTSVRALLGSDDDALTNALVDATALIRDACGWHIAPSRRETVHVEAETDVVFLPTLHLTTVHEVTRGNDTLGWTDPRRAGRVTAPGAAGAEVAVDMTHGLDVVPEALRRLCVLMALRAESSRLGITKEQLGQHSVTFTLTGPQSAGSMVVLDSERSALDPYTRAALP